MYQENMQNILWFQLFQSELDVIYNCKFNIYRFRLFVKQNKQFEDIMWSSGTLRLAFFTFSDIL